VKAIAGGNASVKAGRARHSVRADQFQGTTARTDDAPCLLRLAPPAFTEGVPLTLRPAVSRAERKVPIASEY